MEGEFEVIRSRTNQHLKRVGGVRSGRDRASLLLEGQRLIQDAVAAGHRLELLLVSEDVELPGAALLAAAQRALRVEPGLLARASGLESSPGILGLMPTPAGLSLAELLRRAPRLCLVVAGVADPGNLGALARSAEAAGAEGLIVLEGGARPWNDKALRGSMGSLLRLPVCHGARAEEAAAALRQSGMRQVVAATRSGLNFREFDWRGPLAIWVAPETGAAPAVCDSFEAVTIPMAGAVESLNVSVAAALLLFAAGARLAPRAAHELEGGRAE